MRQKRFLSWIMVFTLLVGMFSFPAYAEGNASTISGDGTADKTGTMTITLVVPKKTPAATDLTYSAPSDLTYSGSDKAATVEAASGVTGLGTITVKYYSDASRTTEATPKNVGTYYVGATVAEGDQYAASTAVLYGDGWTFTITASTPSAPAAPTKASATKNSITLNAVSGCEYSKDGANWQSGTEFTGLNPGTEYTFYQRVKATANTNASAASNAKFSTEADTYAMTITLVIKPAQTITASDVTATYGDTDKSVSATASGAISYAVKDGSGDYISVASDGKLTIKKVPPIDGKAYVIVTAAETDDYAEATKEVTVTISQAEVTVTAKNQSIYVGGTVPDLSAPVLDTHYTVTGLVGEDALTTAPVLAYQKDGVAATPDNTTAGTYDIVASGAAASDNYTITYTKGTLTISDKGTQTITADDVTVTYGDTDKKVSASVTNPTEGGDAISYAVKEGSVDYIDVDATTGALTIKKVPADGKAYVTVTAAGTATYEQATKDVTVTIEKADAAAATVTVNSRNYDGTDQPLVTVTGEAVGGEMQYAIGTATEATGTYAKDIPTATDAGTYYVWYKVVGDENHKDTTPAYVTTVIKGQISATVTFKVVNGSWNDGEGEAATADRIVTLTGYEGDKLMLTAEQIPAVGEKPADGYKAGAWDVTPSTEIEITQDTTYTYTYVGKETISKTVTFKVVNGSWNDGEGEAATADRTVTLTGKEGDVLKLTADQIPAVGEKPADGYKAGAWDVTPNTEIEITQDTTYTYTYVGKETISKTVTFKVVNGSWNDGEGEAATADRIVILTGKEGDVLKLTAEQIPAVGAKPGEGYQAGAWDVTPSTETEIKENTTFIYTYAAQKGKSISYTTYEGEGGEYKHGSDGTLTFVFKRSENDSETFARFTDLKYDGRSLTRDKDYRARTGSVIITLDHELLESMTAGNHILTAVFDDGEADAHFTVIASAEPTATPTATPTVTPEPTVTPTAAPTATPTPTPTPKPVPKTGDNSNPALWLAMMILGCLCIGGVVFRTVRKRG